MFGIGLPELILIMGVALIVVGPEKLPEMAQSIAKGLVELKKTASALKDNITEELDEVAEDPWKQDLDRQDLSQPATSVNEPVIDQQSGESSDLPPAVVDQQVDQEEEKADNGRTSPA